MSGAVFIAITLISSMIVLTREALIIAGLLKGPILRGFQKYGDDEPFYYPFTRIVAALAVFALGIGVWVRPALPFWFMPTGPALLLFWLAWFVERRKEFARRHPDIVNRIPRWQYILREYTSREERRRIAYYWLSLPLKTKILFNSSDRAFLQWADLIVMATVS